MPKYKLKTLSPEDLKELRQKLGMSIDVPSDPYVPAVRIWVTNWLQAHKSAWRKVPSRLKKLIDPYEPPIGIPGGMRGKQFTPDELALRIRYAHAQAIARKARGAEYKPVREANEKARAARKVAKRKDARAEIQKNRDVMPFVSTLACIAAHQELKEMRGKAPLKSPALQDRAERALARAVFKRAKNSDLAGQSL